MERDGKQTQKERNEKNERERIYLKIVQFLTYIEMHRKFFLEGNDPPPPKKKAGKMKPYFTPHFRHNKF